MTIWQTKKWGEMLELSSQVDRIFFVDDLLIEKRKVALGEHGLFILGVDNNVDKKTLEKLINLAKKEKVLFLQIETLDYFGKSENLYSLENNKTFIKGYYKKFITQYTAIIDLNKTEDEILKDMKSKGRYNIRLAKKKGIETKVFQKTEKNIKLFYDLMKETTSRKHFSGNNLEYYKTFLKTLDNSKLILAEIEGKVIAGGIFVFDKNISIYYYGASTSEEKYKKLMAPYSIQWEAIKIAKNYPSKIYDFLGIAGPNEKKSSLAGVTDFKLKLTKDTRKISDSYIFINKKLQYKIIQFIRKLKTLF